MNKTLTHSLILKDPTVPRTVFYELASEAIRNLPDYQSGEGDIVIPYEDTAQETNWPRFGNQASAYISPAPTGNLEERTTEYIQKIANYAGTHQSQTVLILNMHPFRRLPLAFCRSRNVIIADGCLAQHERQANQNTISLPALPMTAANPTPTAANKRPVKVSFQGALSHACRHALKDIDNGKDISIKATDRSNHSGKIDAMAGIEDQTYTNLLDNSTFGIVARGDALFSYRLLETMSRGAIPIIVSDGWVLPFDRTIHWDSCSLRFHQEAVSYIPFVVERIEEERLLELQANAIENYTRFFGSIDSVMQAMLNEATAINRSIRA